MFNRIDGVVMLLAVALAGGCDDGPIGPYGTGFEGTWTADVHGSPMTLEIGDFYGGSLSEGRVLRDAHDWRLSCSVHYTTIGAPPTDLGCQVWPEVSGCITENGGPHIDIRSADATQITAIVGGELRSFSNDGQCEDEGELLVSWSRRPR
jgi:hypothetical protein